MLYELRRYDVAATKLPALIDRFGSFTVHKWKEYGFRLIGFWTPAVGEKSNQVVYIWGWESYEERTKKNAAWRADPERAKKWAETEKDGPLVNRVYNQLSEPTSYSQLDRREREERADGAAGGQRHPAPDRLLADEVRRLQEQGRGGPISATASWRSPPVTGAARGGAGRPARP